MIIGNNVSIENVRKNHISTFFVVVGLVMLTMVIAGNPLYADTSAGWKASAAAEGNRLESLPFDKILLYKEMTELLQSWADARPDIISLESIGQTPDGYNLWFVTLTNQATGPAAEKPAILVDGGMHAVEWAGGVAALHFIWKLVHDFDKDETVTRLLDTRSVYVLPRLSPDGTEVALQEGKIVRSVVREKTQSEEQDSRLHIQDMDGDGRIGFMRFHDPNGPWKVHPKERRLLITRAPEESGGSYWRMVPEGDIDGHDGDTISVPDMFEGIDFGRFFPDTREEVPPDSSQKPDPDLTPEVVSYVEAIKQRPNIVAHVSCHTFGGLILTPPDNRDEQISFDDTLIYKKLGGKAEELTGYRVMSVQRLAEGLPPSPKRISTQRGWLYHKRGIFSFTTEFWNPLKEAGIEYEGPMSAWLVGHHPIEDELQLLRWSDENLDGFGFIPWRSFKHPQLGSIEIGGWDKIGYWYNVPFSRLEMEVTPHTDWLIYLALATPRLQIRSFSANPEAGGQWRLRLVVENTGWLPTFVSRQALEREIVGEITTQLSLPDGTRLVEGELHRPMGQLEGRVEQRSTATWWGYNPGTSDHTFLEWLIEAPEGAEISVTVSHERAGTARKKLTLPTMH